MIVLLAGAVIGSEEIRLILLPAIKRLPRLTVSLTPSKMRTLLIRMEVVFLGASGDTPCAPSVSVSAMLHTKAARAKHTERDVKHI